MRISLHMKIIIASLAFSAGVLCLGFLSGDMRVLGISLILTVFAIGGTIFLIEYLKFLAIKEMEQRFPYFLRDLIEAIRSGVPFHKAVVICSKYDYGKLSKEIKKMAHQITWGIPFDKVIEKFGERLKRSKKIYTAARIIKETHLSGGDVVTTLESVADMINVLEDSEKERKSLLSQYVVLMYAIDFLFIGIVIGINRFMVPIFQVATETGGTETLGLQNPCTQQVDPFSAGFCSSLNFISQTFGLGDVFLPINIGAYYTSLFFVMSLVESICCGLVAGQISENSILAGAKHSLIMIIATFGIFTVLIGTGLMGV